MIKYLEICKINQRLKLWACVPIAANSCPTCSQYAHLWGIYSLQNNSIVSRSGYLYGEVILGRKVSLTNAFVSF